MEKELNFNSELLTPPQIVRELDRFVVGQKKAKIAVAIALRNRWRRKQLEANIREEIVPKNILMIGPTGVGKTEIARRLAKIANAPFIKIEATKFTEVGYVGRDVDSIIRDLTEIAVNLVKAKFKEGVAQIAKEKAEERILDTLIGENSLEETRHKFKQMLYNGELDEREIEIKITENASSHSFPTFDIPGMPGGQMGVINVGEMLGKALGGGDRKKIKKIKVKDAYKILLDEESDKLIDEDKIIKATIELVENDGIVFIDEIDKIAGRGDNRGEVSREGVQRDLLPLIEGTCVMTKYGPVKTDHILFISSGAFHLAKPADLLPELQGRLPIRVEMDPLTKEDMVRILVEPEFSLIKQYIALLATEGVKLEFTDDSIEKIALLATEVNREVENIGARRLHTMLEKLLEDISFNASESSVKEFKIDAAHVEETLGDLVKASDLTKFIL